MSLGLKRACLRVLYEAYDDAIQRFSFACRVGCSHCCTGNVLATTLEADLLLEALEKTGREDLIERALASRKPDSLRSIATPNQCAALCLAKKTPPEVPDFVNRESCPFLEEKGCPVYAARPFECRAMWSQRLGPQPNGDCRHWRHARAWVSQVPSYYAGNADVAPSSQTPCTTDRTPGACFRNILRGTTRISGIVVQTACSAGPAVMGTLLITINLIFRQLVEDLDRGGLYGNVLDLVFYFRTPERTKYHCGLELNAAAGLKQTQANPGFLVPPEHRSIVSAVLADLWTREVEGRLFKDVVNSIKRD